MAVTELSRTRVKDGRVSRKTLIRGNSFGNAGHYSGRDDRGWTKLHIAARIGDLDAVKHLLDGGADVNETTVGPKAPGSTALHLAAIGGHIVVMDELLDRGASIEARTIGGTGWTPLHNAAKERNRKSIRFLLENGAFLPPVMTDPGFNPPLHYCPGLEYAYKIYGQLQAAGCETDSTDSADGSYDGCSQ
eukprot:TRINITY_DN2369_c0_g2_i1.p1 TRINITY_DN2369_c0_g2~~TRINITY_DN2369_c0_g2_i1.p1  ORF type:complete len:190 (-),score=24.60 TRINITY_DN2369_c0_g2_i1:611-1180(-)